MRHAAETVREGADDQYAAAAVKKKTSPQTGGPL